jgi:hypothetical protein
VKRRGLSGSGFNPVAAPDGRTVSYLRGEKEPWLWAVSAEGGAETRVFEAEQGSWIESANWAMVGRGIYFLEKHSSAPYTLKFLDFETRRVRNSTSTSCWSKTSADFTTDRACSPGRRG